MFLGPSGHKEIASKLRLLLSFSMYMMLYIRKLDLVFFHSLSKKQTLEVDLKIRMGCRERQAKNKQTSGWAHEAVVMR